MVLAILLLIFCALIIIGAFVWLAFYDLKIFLQTLGALIFSILVSGAFTRCLFELSLMK